MDLSALIVVLVMNAFFFGFIGWTAIYSRKTASGGASGESSEAGFEEK